MVAVVMVMLIVVMMMVVTVVAMVEIVIVMVEMIVMVVVGVVGVAVESLKRKLQFLCIEQTIIDKRRGIFFHRKTIIFIGSINRLFHSSTLPSSTPPLPPLFSSLLRHHPPSYALSFLLQRFQMVRPFHRGPPPFIDPPYFFLSCAT